MKTSTGRGRAVLSGPRVAAVVGAGAAMVFDGGTASIAAARAFTAGFLAQAASEHAVPVLRRAVTDAQLVVSELVTNAVKYAAGPYSVRLAVKGRLLEITVWDTDPAVPEPRGPEPRGPEPERIGHHGLEVVLALCESFEAHQDRIGKHVTARIALRPDVHPDGGARPHTAPVAKQDPAGKTASDPA